MKILIAKTAGFCMGVRRAVDMFEKVSIPILGLIENMSYYVSPQGDKIQLFPKGELDSYVDEKNLKKLGEIPFNPSIGMAGEAGIPVIESHPTGEESELFQQIAQSIRSQLE